MEEVDVIYHNNLGIAFRWKKGVANADPHRIQMVFKDMGFYLMPEEIKRFSYNIKVAQPHSCSQCCDHKNCRNILLQSPLNKMNFAVSENELHEISDLIEGTLFKIELEHYLHEISRN